jgi:hypothetical protein
MIRTKVCGSCGRAAPVLAAEMGARPALCGRCLVGLIRNWWYRQQSAADALQGQQGDDERHQRRREQREVQRRPRAKKATVFH